MPPASKRSRLNRQAQLAAQAQEMEQETAETEEPMSIDEWRAVFQPTTAEEREELEEQMAANRNGAVTRVPPPDMGPRSWEIYLKTAEAMEAFKLDEVNALFFCIAPDLFAVCRKEPILSSKSFLTTAFGPVRVVQPKNTRIWRHVSIKKHLTIRNLPSSPWM